MKRCSRCGETRPIQGFCKDARNSDGRGAECGLCSNARYAQYREANLDKERARDAKRGEERLQWAINLLGGRCTHPGCGQEFISGLHIGDFRHLEFHHRNPEEKLFPVGNRVRCSRATLLPEIMKCILLCKRHHLEHHHPGCTRDDGFDFNPKPIKENQDENSMGQSQHPGLPGGFVSQLKLWPDPDVRADQS